MLICFLFGFDINLFKVCNVISFIIYFNNIWKDFELKNKKKFKKKNVLLFKKCIVYEYFFD